MYRLFWIVAIATLTIVACDEEIIDPGRGGSQTALFRAEAYIGWTKLAACGGDTALMGLLKQNYLSFDSMPITDGHESAIAIGGNQALGDVLSARTCGDVLVGINHGAEPVSCAKGTPTCVDESLQSCHSFGETDYLIVTDCKNFDMACVDGECRVDDCFGTACDGDALVTCGPNGERRVFDCGALGLTCGHGGDGLQCVGGGDTCTIKTDSNDLDGIRPGCDGFAFVWCLGGRQARINCAGLTDGRRQCSQAWLNLHPDVASDEILSQYLTKACGPVGEDCQDGLTMCDGNDLKICIDGFFEYLDCRSYRFEGCEVTADGARCAGFPRP